MSAMDYLVEDSHTTGIGSCWSVKWEYLLLSYQVDETMAIRDNLE